MKNEIVMNMKNEIVMNIINIRATSLSDASTGTPSMQRELVALGVTLKIGWLIRAFNPLFRLGQLCYGC